MMQQTQFPVVEQALQKKLYSRSSHTYLWGAGINSLIAALIYLPVHNTRFFFDDPLYYKVAVYIAYGLVCIFLLNATWNFCRYIHVCIKTSGTVQLTEQQKHLLGIKDRDPGFTSAPRYFTQDQTSRHQNSPQKSASPSPARQFTAQSYLNPPTPSHLHTTSPGASPLARTGLFASAAITSQLYSPISDGSFTLNDSSKNQQLYSPISDGSFTINGSTNTQEDFSQSFLQPGGTGNTSYIGSPVGSTSFGSFSSTSPRQRKHLNSSSSFSGENSIRSAEELKELFKEQEMSNSPESYDTSGGLAQAFWNFNRGLSEFGPMLRHYAYQVACRSPQTLRTRDSTADDGPSHYEADEIWEKLQVKPDKVDKWIENLRKWLGKTIMVRLTKEIDSINSSLSSLGCHEMEIGEASVSTLKQLSLTKAQYLPNLANLIPFLEISPNQQYVVKRIKELGSNTCLADFKWNSGSDFKGKDWDEHLPSDAELVMHMLCCYMDARLPPNPIHPDGRTFTSSHFIKDPAKPDPEKKESLCLYQSRIYPPHFRVVIKDDVWNLPKGRNNMFYAILLFLSHIKKNEHGMLGKVNLGMSGINILWVLEDNN